MRIVRVDCGDGSLLQSLLTHAYRQQGNQAAAPHVAASRLLRMGHPRLIDRQL